MTASLPIHFSVVATGHIGEARRKPVVGHQAVLDPTARVSERETGAPERRPACLTAHFARETPHGSLGALLRTARMSPEQKEGAPRPFRDACLPLANVASRTGSPICRQR